VPRICRFYGITIAMYYREHGVPHFHALYGGEQATISLDTLDVLSGHLPYRALRLVREWAEVRYPALEDNWIRAREHLPMRPIDPLD
jgi:Domain of unknown function (DUF4160)